LEADINGYFSIFWVDLNTQTRVDNVVLDNKRLIKVVDILGRENKGTKDESLWWRNSWEENNSWINKTPLNWVGFYLVGLTVLISNFF